MKNRSWIAPMVIGIFIVGGLFIYLDAKYSQGAKTEKPPVFEKTGHVRSAQTYDEAGQSVEKTIVAFESDDGGKFTLCFDRVEPWLYPGLHTSIEFEKTGEPCGNGKRAPRVSFDQQLYLLNSSRLE